ncbi:uncharacterized protein LOC115626429 isoform X3 [Scaptodrosophila lebanonensis]|uniref:Uncharacterized protein LOC115626429 isoform X3 n=1 Tax=Drosophila lebanonensis TaxID=7225 RepID=A0A6J2TNN9_DROLE|nr:uncharacterized protein LOC115626429 isoform X3 [Scaptodrosophila lebanonensis]
MDTGQAFVLSFFLDEGLEPNLLAEASQLGITKSLLERRADAAQHEDVNGTDFECVTKDIPVPMLRNQDDQFKEQFRMQRSTFQVLLQATGKAVAGSNEPISHVSLPEKLLYTLRLLSGKVSFREVGEIFAIPKSSGYEIFKWVHKWH